MNLGRRLKYLRGHRSGEEVAKELGISASSLRMYETNQRVPRDSVKKKFFREWIWKAQCRKIKSRDF